MIYFFPKFFEFNNHLWIYNNSRDTKLETTSRLRTYKCKMCNTKFLFFPDEVENIKNINNKIIELCDEIIVKNILK